ncbi:MAG TPA: hypothetical protein VKE74_13115 [Gemmataceae bacterium]|nr:hypothetical protein [Gemmataceae bacterium]
METLAANHRSAPQPPHGKYRRKVCIFSAIGLSSLLSIVVAVLLWMNLSSPATDTESRRIAERDRIGEEIKAFRDRHGRLPDSLSEADLVVDRKLFRDVVFDNHHGSDSYFILCFLPTHPLWPLVGERQCWEFDSTTGVWVLETMRSD